MNVHDVVVPSGQEVRGAGVAFQYRPDFNPPPAKCADHGQNVQFPLQRVEGQRCL